MDKIKVSFKNYKNPQKIAEYTLLLLISTIFLILFSFWTSPFYKNWYGCDASFFTLVGRGMLNGKVMYRDFYDLKGPYFFFIQALGQLIYKGRTGTFLIQLLTLYASVVLIWNTCQLFVNKSKAALILAIFFIGHIATLWGGNTLEEFFLPLSFLCMYLVCKTYKSSSSDDGYPTFIPVILGLSFGIMIFSKISIAGTVLGLIASICFIMLRDKKYKDLLFFILYTLLGILFAAFPVIIYFSYNNCLFDMINCVFVTGFKRSKDFGEIFNITWELKCSGVIFAFVFAVSHKKRCDYNLCVMLMAMSAATYLLLHLGTPFYYYFSSAYPSIVLALCLLLATYEPMIIFESPKQALCIILLAIYLLYYIPASLGSVRTVLYDRGDTSCETYINDSRELAKFIPEFQKNSVFSFMMDMQWYEINDLMPCNRYVINLPFFIELDDKVQPELTDYLNETPPQWLVIGHDFGPNLPEIATLVQQKYSCIYENSVGSLYILEQ